MAFREPGNGLCVGRIGFDDLTEGLRSGAKIARIESGFALLKHLFNG